LKNWFAKWTANNIKRVDLMLTITVEITQDRKSQLLERLASYENPTGEYEKGLLTGLRWMIEKIELK